MSLAPRRPLIWACGGSGVRVLNIIPIPGWPVGSKQLKGVGALHSLLGNRVIEGVPQPNSGRFSRRERLGGILSHYYRDAA